MPQQVTFGLERVVQSEGYSMSKSNLPFKVSKQILATLKKMKFSSIPYKVAFGLERVVQSKGI